MCQFAQFASARFKILDQVIQFVSGPKDFMRDVFLKIMQGKIPRLFVMLGKRADLEDVSRSAVATAHAVDGGLEDGHYEFPFFAMACGREW